jgi:hypothetical protein
MEFTGVSNPSTTGVLSGVVLKMVNVFCNVSLAVTKSFKSLGADVKNGQYMCTGAATALLSVTFTLLHFGKLPVQLKCGNISSINLVIYF